MPGAGGQQPQRATFRPPWVKEGPKPIPMPTAPWTLNSRRDSKPNTDEAPAFTKVTLKSVPKPADAAPAAPAASPAENQGRKTSKITIVPTRPTSDKNASQPPAPSKPAPSKAKQNGRPEPTSKRQLERQERVEKSRPRADPVQVPKGENTTGAPTLSKSSSVANIPPPPPPRPPPPPPSRTVIKDLAPLSDKQAQTLEMLRSRPRKRPDWANMMKEIETNKKLRHVVCNDRSAPLIERVDKVVADKTGTDHFVFESEKSNVHNKLLRQIQSGVKLKSVKTNDRSKPNLEGLRKFRRQMTIEEQLLKAEEPKLSEEESADEMDDIDAVRDDLQSTKQMLALELRNKDAIERENKRLQTSLNTSLEPQPLEKLQHQQFASQARILNLEVELERERSQKSVQEIKQQDQKMVEALRKEAEQARYDAEKLEKEFSNAAEERDKAKGELEEIKRMYNNLEKRMKAGMALAGCPSAKDVARIASQKSMEKRELEESEEEEETSEEESEEDEDPKVAEEKRLQREVKLMSTKIRNLKDKAVHAKKERASLKDQVKKQQQLLREEHKKYKHLQKEVDKMAKLMGDTSDEDNDDKEEESEDEEETESEEESESEESEDEESESDDEEAPLEERKALLQAKTKRHEGRLAALKKGNYLLKAQADLLANDLSKTREDSITLQEDLDSVLAELG